MFWGTAQSMDAETNTSLFMFQSRTKIRRLYVIGGVAILVLGSLALGVIYVWGGVQSASFGFITLLIVFMAALVTTAAVFSGLQLGDRQEAFGLPSGSVRALLAIGIMILFVVFGLPLVSASHDTNKDPPVEPIAVLGGIPFDKLDETVKRFNDQHFVVIVTNYGAPTTTAGTSPPVEHQASIKLLPPDHYADRLDISKQLITAIITLMTSVVSFYFGSRSVTDAMKGGKDTDPASSDLAIRRKELAGRVDALKDALLTRGKTIDQAKTAPDPTNADEVTQRRQAETAVTARRTALDTQVKSVQDLLAAVDQSIANLSSASPADARAVNEQSAKDGLGKLSDTLGAAEATLPAYDAEITAYANASAAG